MKATQAELIDRLSFAISRMAEECAALGEISGPRENLFGNLESEALQRACALARIDHYAATVRSLITAENIESASI